VSLQPFPLAVAKLFSVRFDVDTHRCVREGMPALARLGRDLGAPFTFFVNMGRAVSRATFIRRALGIRGARGREQVAAKLSARSKLGTGGYLYAALANPPVGSGAANVVREAATLGHEIGLHGGRNHAVWQDQASGWTRTRVEAEIDAVLPELKALLDGTAPAGFASPGWSTHPELPAVLAERGFAYLADLHGPTPGSPHDEANAGPLQNVRTQLTGEPGGVAYLEHLRALGLTDAALEERFLRDLERSGDHAVVYDHPYFAGISELALVSRMVELARGLGYEVVPLATLASEQAAT